MGTLVPQGYSGPPLPTSITTLLYTLVQNGFQCEARGTGKTIVVSLNGVPRGYVKRYVLQRRGTLGYWVDPLGREGQRCPAEHVDRLRKRFCERYGCDQSDLIEHPLGGTNSGTSLFIIRHADLALRVLLHDAGINSDERDRVLTLHENSGTAGVAVPPYGCIDVRPHERSPSETLVREPGKRPVAQTDVCGPPAADGSPRIPFLKDFADKHNLIYKPPDKGLQEVSVYSPDTVYRYAFTRWWGEGSLVFWILLNPTTRDTEGGQRQTLRRCIDFSRSWGHAGLIIGNLYAFRANDPNSLPTVTDPVGPLNDAIFESLDAIAECTVVAWGDRPWLHDRSAKVRALLRQPFGLGVGKSGEPRHPARLRHDTPLEPWPA